MSIDKKRFDKLMNEFSEMRCEEDLLEERVKRLSERLKSTEEALTEHRRSVLNAIEDAELEFGIEYKEVAGFTSWTSVLNYFVLELDMGDKWHEGVYEHNGVAVDLSSPDKSFNHITDLVKESASNG